jgi:hypothetical protein
MNERPILVIHGVGNRGKEEFFKNQVEELAPNFSAKLKLIDVFWGDLGAEDRYIEPTVPDLEEVRADGDTSRADEDLGLTFLRDGAREVRDGDGAKVVAEAAVGGVEVRDEAAAAGEVRSAVQEVWPELRWLPDLADDQVLRDAGRLVGEAVAEAGPAAGAPYEVRDGLEIRGPVNIVRRVLKGVDDLVGDLIGRVGGNLNRTIRKTFGPNFAGFFGDIFAYLYGNEDVYERVWETIEAEAPGHGTKERPIGAVAHSLGGVILFDLAVAKKDPLYLNGFVTFGSQSPFFHAISDRSEMIDTFRGEPVTLPDTVRGKWVNLWEPLDLLAFIARKVFRLADGSSPEDRMVPHVNESGLWTHSSYWKLHALPEAMRDVFIEPEP